LMGALQADPHVKGREGLRWDDVVVELDMGSTRSIASEREGRQGWGTLRMIGDE
jgi:hypothetical protein